MFSLILILLMHYCIMVWLLRLYCPKCGKPLHVFAYDADVGKEVYHTYCEYGHFWDVIVDGNGVTLVEKSRHEFSE